MDLSKKARNARVKAGEINKVEKVSIIFLLDR